MNNFVTLEDKIQEEYYNKFFSRVFAGIKISSQELCDCFEIKENFFDKMITEILEEKNQILYNLFVSRTIKNQEFFEGCDLPGTILNGFLLYSLLRHYDMKLMIETGTASGFYASCCGSAMMKNNGFIDTVDIDVNNLNLGKRIPKEYTSIRQHKSDSLIWMKNNSKIKNYDLYSHDSLHTMPHMMKELQIFKECTKDMFIVFIDDQNADDFYNRAIANNFFKKIGYKATILDIKKCRIKEVGGFVKYERL